MKPNRFRFRAWDKKKKVMYAPPVCDYVDPFKKGMVYGGQYFREDVIIMQSTGLVDKNGVEIFEGDILLRSINSRYEVVWNVDEDQAGWMKKSGVMLTDIGTDTAKQLEVIGNIYEDPGKL